jgi:flagellar biosynthetic protein FlhB
VKDFRKRGDIALSKDLVSALTMGGAVIALVTTSGVAFSGLQALTRRAALATDGSAQIGLPREALHTFLSAISPALIGAAIAAVLTILAQVGWPPAIKGLSIDLTRMSPLANLKNAFGMAGMLRRAGSALAKLIVIGAIVALALRNGLADHDLNAGALALSIGRLVGRALWFVLGALVVLGAVDYYQARRRIGEQMKMSSDEIKREMRESDGDPHVKGRRKQKMRELAKRRIAINVAKADVVVVNPTHYAVAIRYDDKKDRAPIVVAKGVDELAEKIREVARKHGVPILARPPLARALHKSVKEGREIPANLYRAVAEVLAYVYRIRHGGRS